VYEPACEPLHRQLTTCHEHSPPTHIISSSLSPATSLTYYKYQLSLMNMHCITAKVLQTKVDAQCDKLVTKLSWQRWQRSTF